MRADDPSLLRRCQRIFEGLSDGVATGAPTRGPRRASRTRASSGCRRGAFISWIPVGLVTLTSVSRPPITSMPTKKSPSRRSRGARRSTIRRSSASRPVAHGAAADVEVGAQLSRSAGTRSSAPSGSPSRSRMRLSPRRDLRQVALRHRPARPEARRPARGSRTGSGRRAQTWKTPSPPRPSRGFTIISPPSLARKSTQLGDATRDERLGHQLGEVQRVELLVGGEDALGPVQHERAAAQREDLGGDDVVGVDGRILALEDDVDVVVERARCAARRARRGRRASRRSADRASPARAPGAVVDAEIAGVDVEDAVAARLRLQHQHEGGVRVAMSMRPRSDPSRRRGSRGAAGIQSSSQAADAYSSRRSWAAAAPRAPA